MGIIHHFTDANFKIEVLECIQPVLVDFWAPWCGPCHMVAPLVEALAEEQSGKLKVGKVNVDENPAITSQYGIRGIPTLLLFVKGEPQEQIIGAASKAQILEKLVSYL